MQDSMSELSGAQRALAVNMSAAPVQADWVNAGPTAQFATPGAWFERAQQFPGIGVALTQVPVAPSQSVPAAPGVPFAVMQEAALSVYAHPPPATAQQTNGGVVVVAPAIVVVVVVVVVGPAMQDSPSELSGAQRALAVNMPCSVPVQ
jgi:hypothetical protein